MNFQKTKDIYGLVLAGGLSTRMGEDKSLLSFHDIPQKDYAFQLLEKYCEKVFTSIGADANIGAFTNAIPDKFSFKSPLNGILSAFQQHPQVAWLTLPVDMPFVDDKIIRFLIANREKKESATCFYDSETKYPEPLLTIWEPWAGEQLLEFYKKGKISPREFLMSTNTHLLEVPEAKALKNINTPEEFEALRDIRGKS